MKMSSRSLFLSQKYLFQIINKTSIMRFNKQLSSTLTLMLFLGLVSSCKIAAPPTLPTLPEIPSSFTGKADSSSIGDIAWGDFFTDPYLKELIETALQQNLDLLVAIQRVEMSRANFLERKGALLPGLEGIVAANYGNISNQVLSGNPRDRTSPNINQDYFLGFQSSWEADIWGRLRNMKKAAYLRFLATEKGKQLVETALIAEVARMYYELLTLDNELEVVHRNVDLQEIALEIIKIQKMGGRATELAVQQFSAQLLGTKALEAEIQQRIVEAENQLNLLLGRFPEPIPRGKTILEQPLPESIHSGLPSGLLLRRPDIQQAELRLAAARADIEAARAAFLPSLRLSPYLGVNAAKTALLFSTPESLIVGAIGSLSAPIFQKRQIRSNFERRSAQNMVAAYDYQKAMLAGFQEVVTDLKRIRNFERIYELKEQEVNVLQSAVSTSNDLFTSGYATYLEVITAQRGVLEAELELANIRKGIFISVIDLYRDLGGGWMANEQ